MMNESGESGESVEGGGGDGTCGNGAMVGNGRSDRKGLRRFFLFFQSTN